MDAGDDAAGDIEDGEKNKEGVKEGFVLEFEIVGNEEDRGAAKRDGEEGVRGGVARFQRAVDEDGAVVDDDGVVENKIEGEDNKNVADGQFELKVDFFETFTTDELDEEKDDEKDGWEVDGVAGKFGDTIPEFIKRQSVMNGFVDPGEADRRFVRTDGPDIDVFDDEGEDDG